MNEKQIKSIVEAVLSGLPQTSSLLVRGDIPIEASARHVHLSQEAFAALFGAGEPTQKRALSQPGEFLAEQRLSIATPHGMIENIAVLGPLRPVTQVELSFTDCRKLGLSAPLRLSGDLRGAADVTLIGPAGAYQANGSVIVAQNHIHMTPADAKNFQVSDDDFVAVRAQTARPVVFENVAVRVSEKFALTMHIDFDEANACMLGNDAVGTIANTAMQIQNIKAIAIEDKVITEARAKELCKTGNVMLRKGTIVTPSARDVFIQAKIEISEA